MRMRIISIAARWFDKSTAPSRHKTSSRSAGRRLSLESLEDRRVLSATPLAPSQLSSPSALLIPLYQDILHRAIDAGGLTAYSNLMAGGALPATIAADLWVSPEHYGLEIDSYYQTFLNRPADASGRQAWVNFMLSGASEELVMADILNSPEFHQINSTPTQFITALYQEVLGRAPDASGLSTYVSQMTTGNVASSDIVWSFIMSTERHMNLVSSYYTSFLNRPADAAGLQYWVGQLDQGLVSDGSAAQAFLSSGEFLSASFLIPQVAEPGQIVVTIVGGGYVGDSTNQINTLIGHNLGVYSPNASITISASSPNVTWSLYPSYTNVQTLSIDPSQFANGLNLTATFH